jgi:DNA modification methylase
MKPYYQHGGITIYCADCRDVLPHLPKMDLCLTDPPYGIKRFQKGSLRFDHKGEFSNGIAWDVKPTPETFALLLASATNAVIWGANNFSLPQSEYFLVWDKEQTVDNFASAELAYTNGQIPAKVFRYSIHQHNANGRYHPTEKPLPLMKWCLSLFPNAKTVTDPYCGSGTTLVAAKAMGLTAIGIELHEPYAEIAAKRLSQEVFDFPPLSTMFNPLRGAE